jgi:hypothetical protein
MNARGEKIEDKLDSRFPTPRFFLQETGQPLNNTNNSLRDTDNSMEAALSPGDKVVTPRENPDKVDKPFYQPYAET